MHAFKRITPAYSSTIDHLSPLGRNDFVQPVCSFKPEDKFESVFALPSVISRVPLSRAAKIRLTSKLAARHKLMK